MKYPIFAIPTSIWNSSTPLQPGQCSSPSGLWWLIQHPFCLISASSGSPKPPFAFLSTSCWPTAQAFLFWAVSSPWCCWTPAGQGSNEVLLWTPLHFSSLADRPYVITINTWFYGFLLYSEVFSCTANERATSTLLQCPSFPCLISVPPSFLLPTGYLWRFIIYFWQTSRKLSHFSYLPDATIHSRCWVWWIR